MISAMRCHPLLVIVLTPCVWACTDPDCNANTGGNVNSRYTIESVDLAGKVSSQELKARLSKKVRNELERLVGQKYNQDKVDEVGGQI